MAELLHGRVERRCAVTESWIPTDPIDFRRVGIMGLWHILGHSVVPVEVGGHSQRLVDCTEGAAAYPVRLSSLGQTMGRVQGRVPLRQCSGGGCGEYKQGKGQRADTPADAPAEVHVFFCGVTLQCVHTCDTRTRAE